MLRRSLILGFLALFILEVFVIVLLGGAIGYGLTVLLLVLGCLAGGWVMRREGARTWRALQRAATSGTPPERELADSALVMTGGLLLLVPGFVTDVLGLVLILPFTRPLLRRASSRLVARQIRVGQERLREQVGAYAADGMGFDGFFPSGGGPHASDQYDSSTHDAHGQVIQGTIIREDRPDGS
jgi:UPF0716 protein FxsA